MRIGARLTGLVLLLLSPAVAAWAFYIFRRHNSVAADYLFNLRAVASLAMDLIRDGEWEDVI